MQVLACAVRIVDGLPTSWRWPYFMSIDATRKVVARIAAAVAEVRVRFMLMVAVEIFMC